MPVWRLMLSREPRRPEIYFAVCDNNAVDFICPSSIRVPLFIDVQDVGVLHPAQNRCYLDVEDLDGNELLVSVTEEFLFVEGKREFFDGRSWVHHQICRRFTIPQGFQMESVFPKRLPCGLLDLSFKLKVCNPMVPIKMVKTMLICDSFVIPGWGRATIKLDKIKTKVVSFCLRRGTVTQIEYDLQQFIRPRAPTPVEPVAPDERPHVFERIEDITEEDDQVQAIALHNDDRMLFEEPYRGNDQYCRENNTSRALDLQPSTDRESNEEDKHETKLDIGDASSENEYEPVFSLD